MHATTQRNLKSIALGEISQTQKALYFMFHLYDIPEKETTKKDRNRNTVQDLGTEEENCTQRELLE